MTPQLKKKIDFAIRLLKNYDNPEQPIEIAYSGGKDSDVILQLAKESGIHYRAIYRNTTIDPTVTTLTLQDFDKYVKTSDIVVRAKFETEDKFNERLRAELEGIERADIVEKAYVSRKENQGGNGGTNPGGGSNEEEIG